MCYFCGKRGHIKPYCRSLEAMTADGHVHLDAMNRICPGPPGSGSSPIFPPRDGTTAENHIRNLISSQNGRATEGASVRALRLGSLGPTNHPNDDSEEEDEFENGVESPGHMVGIQAARAVTKDG